MTLDQNDSQALADAVHLLESQGLAIQIAEIIGKPIQYGVGYLPDSIVRRIGDTECGTTHRASRGSFHDAQ